MSTKKYRLKVTITGWYTVDLSTYDAGTYGKNPTAVSVAKMEQNALSLIDMSQILDGNYRLKIKPARRRTKTKGVR